MFRFSGDTYRDDSPYAGSASGLNFLLYAMSMVVGIVTGANIQSANEDGPGILNEFEEGTELWRDGAGSHCSCLEYVMACFVGMGNEL